MLCFSCVTGFLLSSCNCLTGFSFRTKTGGGLRKVGLSVEVVVVDDDDGDDSSVDGEDEDEDDEEEILMMDLLLLLLLLLGFQETRILLLP